MKNEVLKFLRYSNQVLDESINNLIDECILEIEKISNFSYVYINLVEILDFLDKPAYKALLEGCSSYYLIATTLGHDVDKKINLYQKTNPTRSLVLDACASAYIIKLADEYEEKFGVDRTFRFCPGYENTPLDDNKIILDILRMNHPNVTFLESKMLSPFKSMVGIIGIGKKTKKDCKSCVVKKCSFKESGTLCFKK